MTAEWFHLVGIDSGSWKNNWDGNGCVTARYNTITIDKIFYVSLHPPT